MRLDGVERKQQDPLGSTGSERALGRYRSRGKACVAQKLHHFQWWQSVHILCFACAECNWAKGPNLAGLFDGKLYPLFNPRKQSWKRHFRWDNAILVGKIFCGKVTVQV
ncbi:MAG: hypothetical protein ACXU95_07460, partial [Isosphaeraceae bacterium]